MIKTFAGRTALFLAAAMMAASPTLAQELVVTRPGAAAPVKPGEPVPQMPKPTTSAVFAAPAPVTPSAPAASVATSNTPVASAGELPAGAPADDYEFLGWCTGILSGHLELYTRVKPELDAISKRWNTVESDAKQQAEQQAVGKELLGQFRHAMGTMEAASATPISFRGQTAIQKGLSTWSGVDKLDKQNQAYSWMNFGLPGRCENKAAEVEKAGGKVTTKTVAMTTSKPVTPAPAAPVPAPAKPAAPKPVAKVPTAKDVGLRR